ncbi:MAG: LacI family transcriptional regulator [Dysgonamonadaceae bacterium]|jgi:LacI family transcriptional regulator|nr:LacI family transcriptional regulator [Dysgonamonadaceae bacterium]
MLANNAEKIKKVSMQDIADAAGVARSTVSFVLNGKEKEGRISESIAQKVREVAKRMNYQFNAIARSLRTGRSYTVALVVADISDVFFGTLAYHLQECAEEKGYLLVIMNTGEKQKRIAPVFNMLANRQVDGIIAVPVSNTESNSIEQLCPNIPIVFVDRYFKTFNTSRVRIDNYEISKTATQLLLGKGCKRIAIISYKETLMHIYERKRGYIDALKANHCYDESLVCEVNYFDHKDHLAQFLKEHLQQPHAIDGIFMATGGLSSATIHCLADMGVKPQTDVQLIGFGRIDTASDVSIPYVKQPMLEICKHSLSILLDQIESPEKSIVDCVLPASIVID